MTSEIFKRYGENPVALCREWLAEAAKREPHDPEAVCLATCGQDGQPTARMVLIKDIGADGFKFHTNAESEKGRNLSENPLAELCFYWKSLRRQVRVRGPVETVSTAESDEYFKARPRERQIGAWASRQSQAFEKREELEQAVRAFEAKYEGKTVPRPPGWQGYRLIPQRIEFWIAQKDRLHTRFVYVRDNTAPVWTATWLWP